MIRLRKKNGDLVNLEDEVVFVEICDMDKNPAMVLYQNEAMISQITPDTEEAEIYQNRFNCKFAKIIDLKDRYEDDLT